MSRLDDKDLHILNGFVATVWGKPGALLRQTEHFEYIDLGEYHDGFQRIYSGRLKHPKILVTDEFRLAFEALKKPLYSKGACILGQPGIGKSLFLMYALVRFLGQRHGVAFQTMPEYYIFFRDTVSIHDIIDSGPLHDPLICWTLSDSGSHVQSPADIFFTKPGDVRVIHCAKSRREQWSRNFGARAYVMDIWSTQDITNLARLFELDVQRMTMLADKWGSVPRTLLTHFQYQDNVIEALYHCRALGATSRCPKQVRMWGWGMTCDVVDDAPPAFCFIRPENKRGTIDRTHAAMYVPTETICDLLADARRNKKSIKKLRSDVILRW